MLRITRYRKVSRTAKSLVAKLYLRRVDTKVIRLAVIKATKDPTAL